MDAQKPKIPTLKDAKTGKADFKIKGLAALSFVERLKQFKKKDLAFILAGLGVLFMAPVAEHFLMTPDAGDPNVFKQGFGVRDAAGSLGRGGSPYEPGYSGLAPGGLLGSGSDVITPLNVRDPSALVMGPGSSQPTPVTAPPAKEPSASKPSSDWKDALANAATRGAKEAGKNAALPVPKIPLQGGLRGLGVLGGGGGGGGYNLPAISAGNVPNAAAAGGNLSRAISPTGYKGLASRGPNVGGSGGMEGLKKAAAGAAGEMNRGGSAAGNLENAAAASNMGGGSDMGGAGAGGASAGEKGSSQNSNLGSKNQGESLELMMAKSRMEKELDMYYKKLEKKDWELWGYDVGHKALETFITDGVVKPLATCLGGLLGGDPKDCQWVTPSTDKVVTCIKGPPPDGGKRFKVTKNDPFCRAAGGRLGCRNPGSKPGKDGAEGGCPVCPGFEAYSGCEEGTLPKGGVPDEPGGGGGGPQKPPVTTNPPIDGRKPDTAVIDTKDIKTECEKLAGVIKSIEESNSAPAGTPAAELPNIVAGGKLYLASSRNVLAAAGGLKGNEAGCGAASMPVGGKPSGADNNIGKLLKDSDIRLRETLNEGAIMVGKVVPERGLHLLNIVTAKDLAAVTEEIAQAQAAKYNAIAGQYDGAPEAENQAKVLGMIEAEAEIRKQAGIIADNEAKLAAAENTLKVNPNDVAAQNSKKDAEAALKKAKGDGAKEKGDLATAQEAWKKAFNSANETATSINTGTEKDSAEKLAYNLDTGEKQKYGIRHKLVDQAKKDFEFVQQTLKTVGEYPQPAMAGALKDAGELVTKAGEDYNKAKAFYIKLNQGQATVKPLHDAVVKAVGAEGTSGELKAAYDSAKSSYDKQSKAMDKSMGDSKDAYERTVNAANGVQKATNDKAEGETTLNVSKSYAQFGRDTTARLSELGKSMEPLLQKTVSANERGDKSLSEASKGKVNQHHIDTGRTFSGLKNNITEVNGEIGTTLSEVRAP